jgi:hypothetical protein
MRSLKPVGIKFDLSNPFTHCDTNNVITTEEEHKLLGMSSQNKKKTFQPSQAAFTHACQFYKKDRQTSFPEQVHKESYYRTNKLIDNFGLKHATDNLDNGHPHHSNSNRVVDFGKNPSATAYNQITHSEYQGS